MVAVLEGKGLKNSAEVVDYLAKTCFVKSLSEPKRKELAGFLGELPPAAEWAGVITVMSGRCEPP